MFELNLVRNGARSAFNRQLPFFNWYYPFDRDEQYLVERLSPFPRFFADGPGRRAAYFHIPFCETVCSFCPFTRGLYRSESEVEDYLDALLTELTLKRAVIGNYAPSAIFVGGGTPSVLTPSHIQKFGDALRASLDLQHLQECSFELEVKSVTLDKLSALRDIGVTRVSFGTQTFSRRHREFLSLDASVQQIRQVAKWANRLFTYTNTDIIYGLAGETREELLRDASEALALGTTTVDFYPINNLSAQPRMHKAADAAGCETLAASVKMTYRMLLDQFMLSQNYVPISGYAYAVATDADAPAHVRESPRFLYHDIIYGYHDDVLIGYGSAALQSSCRSSHEYWGHP